jgi:hypothetical protein
MKVKITFGLLIFEVELTFKEFIELISELLKIFPDFRPTLS